MTEEPCSDYNCDDCKEVNQLQSKLQSVEAEVENWKNRHLGVSASVESNEKLIKKLYGRIDNYEKDYIHERLQNERLKAENKELKEKRGYRDWPHQTHLWSKTEVEHLEKIKCLFGDKLNVAIQAQLDKAKKLLVEEKIPRYKPEILGSAEAVIKQQNIDRIRIRKEVEQALESKGKE